VVTTKGSIIQKNCLKKTRNRRIATAEIKKKTQYLATD
jgi:hypothetical protein